MTADGPGTGGGIPRDEVFELVAGQLSTVLAIRRDEVTPDAHLAADLHADSLDLVEAVERVERSLAERGLAVRVPEDSLGQWNTVEDAVRGIGQALRGAPEGWAT